MIVLWLLCASASMAVESEVEEYDALLAQATAAFEARDYAKSAELFEAAWRAGATAPPAPYSAACCYALLGESDEAFTWLDRAIDAGWREVEYLKADENFSSLHTDPRWERAVHRCQEQLDTFNKSVKEPTLREELLKRMREDQRIRMTPNPDMLEWHKIDADNTAFMRTVIEKHGWPGKSMVGSDGALAAFLLVQHADADATFQKRCLELLSKAVQQNEARAQDMAYLTDRVLVAEGKPQRYGTQFRDTRFLGLLGEFKPYPIEDEANVDSRRKEVGLPPLAEYIRQMKDMDGP